jgi:hypothetical protein
MSTGNQIKAFNIILAGKLLTTSSISSLRPAPTITSERDISEANYLEHLAYMKQKFSHLSVSENIRKGSTVLFLMSR